MSTSKRLRVLWLCSWYPSEVDRFSGDFIQRHAEAVSALADVQVLHCIGSSNVSDCTIDRAERMAGLKEWIGYYPKKTAWDRLVSPIRWWFTLKLLVDEYIVQHGQPDLVHVQVPFKSGLMARYIRRRFGIPYVVTEHWGIYQEQSEDRFSNRSILFKKLTKYAYSGAALSISVSEFQAKSLNKYMRVLPYQIVRNVVDTKQFNCAQRSDGVFRFIHVSDWSQNKNPEGILRAYFLLSHLYSNTELVLVGGKGMNAARVKCNESNDPDSVKFVGEVSYTEVSRLVKQADCLILFSQMENSPCVIGEALCAGLQVIATDVGGVSELMDPACCQLVPASDEGALHRAMEHAINRAAVLDKNAGSQRASKVYSYDAIGRSIVEGYLKVVGGRYSG